MRAALYTQIVREHNGTFRFCLKQTPLPNGVKKTGRFLVATITTYERTLQMNLFFGGGQKLADEMARIVCPIN